MEPIKLGIIGCGIAAQTLHWPALQKLTDKFKITAVCNRTEEKAKRFVEMIGGSIPYFLDYHELLKKADVEAVDIALPFNLNYQVTQDALLAGKHVIVEKPIAANLTDAKKMADLEEKFPLVTMLAENFRYRLIFKKAKTYLEQGRVGEPYAVFWNMFTLTLPDNNVYARTEWRKHPQYKGGFVTDGGIHYIAALRDLFGEIKYGIALTKSVNPNLGDIDSMSFQFFTDKNINGILNLFYSSKGYEEDSALISCSKGSILIEGNKLTICDENNEQFVEEVEDGLGYREEFEDFYDGIRLGTKVKSTFNEGYKDLQVIIGAIDSVGKWRDLELG